MRIRETSARLGRLSFQSVDRSWLDDYARAAGDNDIPPAAPLPLTPCSDLLSIVLDPGLVGGLVLPVMGAVPDGAIVLFSGACVRSSIHASGDCIW